MLAPASVSKDDPSCVNPTICGIGTLVGMMAVGPPVTATCATLGLRAVPSLK